MKISDRTFVISMTVFVFVNLIVVHSLKEDIKRIQKQKIIQECGSVGISIKQANGNLTISGELYVDQFSPVFTIPIKHFGGIAIQDGIIEVWANNKYWKEKRNDS